MPEMDFLNFQHEVIDRLARIETSVSSLPGRIEQLEDDVRNVERKHAYVTGAFALGSAMLSLAVFAGLVGHWLGIR